MNIFKQKEREFALNRIPVLKEKFPESNQILNFLSHILEYHNSIISEISDLSISLDNQNIESRLGKGKPALKLSEYDFEPFLKYFYPLLNIVYEHGTPQMKERVEHLQSLEKKEILSLISSFLENGISDDMLRFFLISYLQPILYTFADKVKFEHERWFKNYCPVCGSKPSVSFIMDTEDWEGARFLRCSVCLTDWLYVRTKCVNCGNVEDDSLDYFISSELDYIEIQTCKKCNSYIKIIDLRKDGLAVPDLEDIASVSLDLWAQEQGFIKVERNFMGY
ncbi:formate dehydrogenase accessory protein FdhE [Aquifex aeolicus]|nr:formate dehydrogenase accessory protein FdhE [Aquifex aeolicus]